MVTGEVLPATHAFSEHGEGFEDDDMHPVEGAGEDGDDAGALIEEGMSVQLTNGQLQAMLEDFTNMRRRNLDM